MEAQNKELLNIPEVGGGGERIPRNHFCPEDEFINFQMKLCSDFQFKIYTSKG